MKKFYLSLLIIGFAVSAFAQTTTVPAPKIPVDSVTNKITYTEVVQQKGTKDTLFNRAIHWCNTNGIFHNVQEVTKVRDRDNGKIEGIYNFKVINTPLKDGTRTDGGIVSYTFTIDIKDNKYRITLTKLNLKSPSYFPLEKWLNKQDPSYTAECNNYLTQVDKYMKDFIANLKKGMTEAKKVNDNW